MKKIGKISIILTILIICFMGNNNVYADYTEGVSGKKDKAQSSSQKKQDEGDIYNSSVTEWKDGFKYADIFTDGNIKWSNDTNEKIPNRIDIENKIKLNATSIYKFLLAIGTVLTVIVGAILGISFMISSAEDKAKIKEKMIPYIAGTAIIFGAVTIWYTVIRILGQMN